MTDKENPFLTAPVAILVGSAIVSLSILISGGVVTFKGASLNAKTAQVPSVTPSMAGNQGTTPPQGPVTIASTAPGIKTFLQKKDAQTCKVDGKPVVYLFSTTWCPHCKWISETFDKVVTEYVNKGQIVAYHWDIDVNDNTLTTAKETQVPEKDSAIYQEFNPNGSIPTFVFGCKYFRVGNGYEQQQDLAAEEAEFRAAIGDLLR